MTAAAGYPSLRFLAAGSETGREILSADWSGSALGAIEGWPVSLRTTLACPVPMFLAWGPELISFYNDPYREVLGGRVARALGALPRALGGRLG